MQYCSFVLQWLVGALAAAPYLLTSCLLTVWLAVLLARRVISHAPCPAPPLWAVPVLLLATAALATRLAVLQREAVALQSQLETQRWRAEQGARHRLDLLARLAGAGAGQRTEQQQTESLHNPLDGCLHVFIDLGSNRGLQIRKLYEPQTFPLAPVQELYTRHFGRPEQRVLAEICSVSFEPNSRHSEHLRQLAASYATCGIRVLVYQAGVGHRNTTTTFAPFNSLLGHEVGHDASARLIHEDETVEEFAESHFHDKEVEVEQVEVVRFASFITDVVARRQLPLSAEVTKPSVVIKADIEGAELKILPDMVVTGALQHVDNIHMEWHGESSYRRGREPQMIDKLAPAITALAELSASEGLEHKFEVEEMDDETYSGMLIYKPWGDYTELPMMTC